MLARELLTLFKDVTGVVDVSPGTVDLRRLLMVPGDMPYATAEPAGLDGTATTDRTLLLGLVGPQEGAHTPAAGLSPALRALPVGAKVLVLSGWTLEELPYRQLPGPLADGRCQVTDVVPVEWSGSAGVHLALVAERVDERAGPAGGDASASSGAWDPAPLKAMSCTGSIRQS